MTQSTNGWGHRVRYLTGQFAYKSLFVIGLQSYTGNKKMACQIGNSIVTSCSYPTL